MSLLAAADHWDYCLLRKLSKDFDESDHHPEYDLRQQDLDAHFNQVIFSLKNVDFAQNMHDSSKELAAVYLLYKELQTDGPWKDKKYDECADRMDHAFKSKNGISVGDLLKTNHSYNRQHIFRDLMYRLHLKLTAKDFKKYPSHIKVYTMIFMNEFQDYHVFPTVRMLPISLYLIDDYIPEHKKSGLTCCNNILLRLNLAAFSEGNYYEVIYASLKKAIIEKDINITKLTINALWQLAMVMRGHADFHRSMCEELLDLVLDQILTESSIPRRAVLFGFLANIIQRMGVNCVNRQSFQHAVCDNLEIACQPGVEDIILQPVIQVLEVWISQCWCAWSHKSSHKTISALYKVLCTCREEEVALRVLELLAAIYSLSPEADQEKFEEGLARIEALAAHKNDDLKKKRISFLRAYCERYHAKKNNNGKENNISIEKIL